MNGTMKQFNAARRVSVPLIIWKTPDAAATISGVKDGANYPIFSWDIARGIKPVNELAVAGMGKLKDGDGNPMTAIGNAAQMLDAMTVLPDDTVMFMHNAHLYVGGDNGQPSNPFTVQGIWNLRDSNKAEHKTLIMLASQMRTPMELANDMFVIDERLPNDAELREIVETQVGHAKFGAKNAGVECDVSDDDITKAVDALSGLSAFAAEQTVAVSFEKNGKGVKLNLNTVWERKKQSIEETRGLKVWRDGETLDDVKGCAAIKKFAQQVIDGRMPPKVYVFIDEIEKSGVANTGDTSGTNMDQLGVLLTKMQDTKAQGIICVGPPGSAKSMFSKAIGNSAGVPTIQMDMGAMKGSLVGQSEQYFRQAMKVIDAVGQDRVFYIATCNDIASLPPALRRRFTEGTFYFDLPTETEGADIWAYYLKKYSLKGDPKALAKTYLGWTGADIFGCAKRAWMFRISVDEAAKYATPVCETDPAGIERLRNLADGKFLSANYEGKYRKDKDTVKIGKQRKMEF